MHQFAVENKPRRVCASSRATPMQMKSEPQSRMKGVRIHYNSSKPRGVGALAYTQGGNIYIAPGQEKHLNHELGHAKQQEDGRVRATGFVNGIPINDDPGLESEADRLGETVQLKGGAYTGKGIIQRYLDVGGGFRQSRTNLVSGQREIMVKKNQAAALYIREGVVPPPTLLTLGIDRGAETVNDPNPAAPAPPIRYSRYVQRPLGAGRTADETTNAEEIFVSQSAYLNILFTSLGRMRAAVANYEELRNVGKRLNSDLAPYHAIPVEIVRKTALVGLGGDVLHAANALTAIYKVAEQDRVAFLDLIEGDLQLRSSQLEAERSLSGFKPVIPTDCEKSTIMRGARSPGLVKVRAGLNKRDFDGRVGWNFHFGSEIPTNLTGDAFFIEDAVGKSSGGSELANAHWFASLYGDDEAAAAAAPAPVPAAAGIALPADRLRPVQVNAACSFNRLNIALRKDIIESHALRRDNSFEVYYQIGSQPPRSTLSVRVMPDFSVSYTYTELYDNNTPAELDFVCTTANAIVDNLIVNHFSKRAEASRDSSLRPWTFTRSGDLNKHNKIMASIGKKRAFTLNDYRIPLGDGGLYPIEVLRDRIVP